MKRIDISKYHNIAFKDFGRDFSGVDCLGLPGLFYKTEFGIIFPEFKYESDWEKQDEDLIAENYQALCERIEKPERYSLVAFRMPGHFVEHHLGIVLWDLDQFLHSPLNQPSRVEKLSHPVWKRSISSFYRVKGIA